MFSKTFSSCNWSSKQTYNKESSDNTATNETVLSINNDTVFQIIKEKFVFSDSMPIVQYQKKQTFDRFNIEYAEWLDTDQIIILTSVYNKPNKFIVLNTVTRKVSEMSVLTKLFETCGSIFSPTHIRGLSANKDYFLFSCGGYGHGSGIYKLLVYDLKNNNLHNIEDYINDKDIIYKKTGKILHTDGREYSFLPNMFSKYGQFSFTKDNGFQIKQSVLNFNEEDNSQKYFTTIKFPSLQKIINQTSPIDFPIINSEKISSEESEKRLYFSIYYDRLPVKIVDGKLFNAPRKNSMGGSVYIKDEGSPYLFLPFTYYLNPKTLTPKFDTEDHGDFTSIHSISNEKQARYTGLLVNDKNTYELKKILVHGIGVQRLYKRESNFMATSIFSDKGDNHLVIWDIETFKPIAKLNLERKTNYMQGIFFDEKNKQIIAVYSNPAKIFVWDYYPE